MVDRLKQLTARQYAGLPEIASRQRDITRPWVAELDYPDDPTLQAAGWDWEIYDALLRDDQVFSTFQQRRLAVVSREYEVVAGGNRKVDQAAADFISEVLAEPSLTTPVTQQIDGEPSLVGFDALTDKMLFGRFWGIAVAELFYAHDGRFIYPEQIKVRKQRRFRFDRDGRLRLLTPTDPFGERVEERYPRKFWMFRCGGQNDDDPYAGNGLAPVLYWPCWFKRNGLKFWAIYLETESKPRVVGKHSPGTGQEDIAKLLAAVEAVQSGAAVTIPEGMLLEVLEAAQKADSYEQFAAYWDRAIAKCILGQVMTSEAVGGQYKAEVQFDVRAELIKADADLVNGSANQTWIRWLTHWNYPTATPPRVWRRLSDEPDLKPQAERDKILFDMGYAPNTEYVIQTYGQGFAPPENPDELFQPVPLNGAQVQSLVALLEQATANHWPAELLDAVLMATLPQLPEQTRLAIVDGVEKASPQTPQPSPPNPLSQEGEGEQESEEAAFAEGDGDPVTVMVRRLAAEADPEIAAMVEVVQRELGRAESLEEFNDRLLALYPELDGGPLAEQLATAMAAARLAGRAAVVDEIAEAEAQEDA